MTNPTAAMLVIGDEILSGRTRDTNTHYLAGELTRIGITLREVRVVADDHDDDRGGGQRPARRLRPSVHQRRHRPDA